MFHAARSASLTARPKRGLSGSGCTACGPEAPSQMPSAVFARTTSPVRAVTIEYSIQIHSAAGSWTLADGDYLAARMHTFHSHDGFAVEDGWIHLPDGTLLATVRQSRLAG